MRPESDHLEPLVQEAKGPTASAGGHIHVLMRPRAAFFSQCHPNPGTKDAPMRHWLMKSEPDGLSIDDLAQAPRHTTAWFGVRNYQARNFMRDEMTLGDQAFFYHSSCAVPGIAGIVTVTKPAYPDATQFDRGSKYFDPKATRARPRWFNVEVTLVRKTRLVPLPELRAQRQLSSMRLLARGNRLSITPVTTAEWQFILHLMEKTGKVS